MKKIMMLLSLFSVVGMVESAQKKSLQEECEKARLAAIATKEHKNQCKQNEMCRDIEQIIYDIEVEVEKAK